MKGQTAMEYLMTYGWAILIVIIVAAALYALGVFSPPVGERATGFYTLGTPSAWTYTTTDDLFKIKIRNGLGSTITVSEVKVELSTGGTSSVNDTSISISPGNVQEIVVNCSANGDLNTLASGDSYSVKVTITYTPTGGYQSTDTGTITGKAI
jgi:hypothetical protein